MKISKSTQRRIVALFVIVCLMFLPDLILSVVRVVFDEDWRTTENITYVGTLDVNRLNSHLIQILCGIWIFLLNVVHSGTRNQYTSIILVHFQYTFDGSKNKNPSRSVSRGVE